MSRNARIALFMAVAAVALIAGFVLRQSISDAPPAVAPEANRQLLMAELPDLTGVKQRLEQWNGNVLVVNFWATWCAPCREEIPDLIRGQQRLGEKGVQIIGIAVDDLERVKPYAAEIGINYPVLVSGLEGAALSRLAGNKAEAFPFTVVIDRTGRIAGSHLGRVSLTELEKLVGPLL